MVRSGLTGPRKVSVSQGFLISAASGGRGGVRIPPKPKWLRVILNAAIWGELVAALCLFIGHLDTLFLCR